MILDRIKHLSTEIQKRIVEEAVEFSDAPKVTEEEFNRRISLCEACGQFNPEDRRCKLCTCFMDIKAELKELPFALPGMDKVIKCSDKENPKW